MDIMEAIRTRHSVRQYEMRAIEEHIIKELSDEVDECNRESGLHIQLVTDEPEAFDGFMAHYGKFSGVMNYIALIGRKSGELDCLCGYYGERIAIRAQQLGLNSCWVAMTYKKVKDAFVIDKGEKLTAVIAIGYGKMQGAAHKIKSMESVSNVGDGAPEWFAEGVRSALLAPTAMNQQKFKLIYSDGKVEARAGVGFYSKVDLGIVKYHFEAASGVKIL